MADGMLRFPRSLAVPPRLGGPPVPGPGTGYPWVDGDILYAADLNAAIGGPNVQDFGAKGDGTTDDTVAIQTAVSAGGTIRFPTGRYIISTPIASPTSGPITIIGDGLNASVIIQTTAGADGWDHSAAQSFQMFGMSLMCNGVGGTALKLNFLSNVVANLTLRDVQIIGNGNQTTNFWHDGIIANGASVMTLDHVNVTGTNNGPLANIGNGLYLTPPLAPAADAGSYVFWINNSNFSYYQTAIVLDSTGHTANIQGVMLEWVNSNYCMQFVKVLGTILELNILHCQYEGLGSAFHAEGADTVVIRDCLFFCSPNATMAIASQLPQDVIYGSGGGNWWIKDNRFVLQPGSTVNYFFNFQNSFNVAKVRDNVVWTQFATALGFINIASGCANIEESGTATAFWGSWPMLVNGNAIGGIGNSIAFGSLASVAAPTASSWQNQGSYVGFNYGGGGLNGETDFINSRGGGTGGFNFFTVASTPSATPALIASLSGAGNLDIPSGTVTATGCISNIASVATSLVGITGTQWQQAGAWTAFNYQGTSGLNGETDFINSRGGGVGGFAWFTTPSSSSATPTLLAKLDASGNFTARGLITPSGISMSAGAGVPTDTQPSGSLWLRSDGATGARLYVSAGDGNWTAVAGV